MPGHADVLPGTLERHNSGAPPMIRPLASRTRASSATRVPSRTKAGRPITSQTSTGGGATHWPAEHS